MTQQFLTTLLGFRNCPHAAPFNAKKCISLSIYGSSFIYLPSIYLSIYPTTLFCILSKVTVHVRVKPNLGLCLLPSLHNSCYTKSQPVHFYLEPHCVRDGKSNRNHLVEPFSNIRLQKLMETQYLLETELPLLLQTQDFQSCFSFIQPSSPSPFGIVAKLGFEKHQSSPFPLVW